MPQLHSLTNSFERKAGKPNCQDILAHFYQLRAQATEVALQQLQKHSTHSPVGAGLFRWEDNLEAKEV